MVSAFFDYDWSMRPTASLQPRLFTLALLAAALLSACAPASLPPAPTLPATQWLRVQVSPSLTLFNDLFSTCTPAGVGLAIQQISGTAFAADQVDLSLRWGAGPQLDGYAAEIGEEELVAVTYPDNPVQTLDLPALRTAFAGGLPAMDWDYLGQAPQSLNLYAYPSSSDIQAILAAQLLPQGQALPREVIVAPGPAEVRDAVAADAGALGFLPRRWVDERVKMIAISDLPAGAWSRPILAISAVEPQGAARQWLLCVQQGMQ